MERLLPASPDRVFDAWVNPRTLVKWWGPEGFTTPEQSLDVVANGQWRTVMQGPDGQQHVVSGVYREIEPPTRLVFTWAWEDSAGNRGADSEVELTLRAVGSGTRLLLVHRQLADAAARESHREGWSSSLNDLERLFA